MSFARTRWLTLLMTGLFLVGCQSSPSKDETGRSPRVAGSSVASQESLEAQGTGEGGPPWDQPWVLEARPTGGYIFGGDLEGTSGSIDVAIAGLEVQARGGAWPASQVGLGLNYEYRSYAFDFDGAEPFFGTAGDQSVDFHSLGLSASLLQAFNKQWGAFVRAGVRGSSEVEADLLDGISWNVMGGLGYRFSDRLLVGLGVGVIGRLEEDTLIIPVVQLRWLIDDQWSLRLEGPSLALGWKPAENWEFSLGAGFDSRRYRLENETPTNAGIFEDRRIPVTLKAKHTLDETWAIDGTVGVDVYRRFKVEDRNGGSSLGFDADPGVFIGLGVTATF